jgi:hypothetical protein
MTMAVDPMRGSERPPVPDLDGPSLLHGVLSYEGGRPENRIGRATRFILGTFAVLSLLGGGLCLVSALGTFYRVARVMQFSPATLAYLVVPVVTLTLAFLHIGVGASLLVRRPIAWRAVQRLTGILMALSLVAVLFGLGLVLAAAQSGKGMGLTPMLGLLMAGLSSVPFWWNLSIGAYLLGATGRRAFAIGAQDTSEPLQARRTLIRIMWITYLGAAALTAAYYSTLQG